MSPIGEYVPDFTEDIKGPVDIPEAKIVKKSRNYKHIPCPKCRKRATRDRVYQRELHDLGDPRTGKPQELHFTYSQHHCKDCDIYFHDEFSDITLPYSQYSSRVVHMAIRLVVEDGLPYGEASWHLWRDHFVWVPRGTVQNWVEASGKKGVPFVEGPYLDDVLSDFSGYLAIDEVYDGPFCILSIVDNRHYQRLIFEVLDHSPEHSDIIKFLSRFQQILAQRNLKVLGVTTDGSPLYPEPLKLVFPGVPHQLCEFHVIKEINKAVLRAVAQIRREIVAKIPKVKRGKARDAKERKARQIKKRLEKKIGDLFEHRYLFVQRKLSQKDAKVFRQITRGFPTLRRFREIMNEVYGLFDKRCKLSTGLKKLENLRRKVLRFKDVYATLKKILSPNLEKALTFLDEKLLPSTSNAVERGNRRFRKMQKSIYRGRTLPSLTSRIALDMIRGVRHYRRPRIEEFLRGLRCG